MKTSPFLLTLLMLSVAFAGCTEGDGGQDPSGGDPADPDSLQMGKGGIKGLLVDDRYRPIHIVEDEVRSEYQTTGFILVQETAEEVLTNSNGEFVVTNLAPGPYTLRVQADGYDAKSTTVVVEAGLYAETTVEARRILSEGSFTVATEHTVYISCAFDYFASGGNGLPPHLGPGCDGDLSTDGYSSTYFSDYTSYGDNATWMVTEMLANQERPWEVQIRSADADGNRIRYATVNTRGDYVRAVMERGENADDYQQNPGYEGTYVPWNNDRDFQTIFFVDHDGREEAQSIPVAGGLFCCGAGVSLGIKAKILQTVFLGPPEVDPESYCVLCE